MAMVATESISVLRRERIFNGSRIDDSPTFLTRYPVSLAELPCSFLWQSVFAIVRPPQSIRACSSTTLP